MNMIEQLQKNLATLRAMDGDLRRAMESIPKKDFIFLLPNGTWDKANPKQGFEQEIYRLRADYVPESQIVRIVIDPPDENGVLRYYCHKEGKNIPILCAPNYSDFIGFLYEGEDGQETVAATPRIYQHEQYLIGEELFLKYFEDGSGKVLTPVAVLFSKGE